MKAHLDFETLSGCGIQKAGADKYSRHPSTDIMCASFAFDDEEPVVMGIALQLAKSTKVKLASQADWIRFNEHVQDGGIVGAHNAPFELAIWNNVGRRKYGWQPLRPEQMDCTMARAYAMSLPGSLDGARAAAGITVEKDAAGNRLMRKMSQPKTVEQCPYCWEYSAPILDCDLCNGIGTIYTWYEDPEEIERLFSYNATDILVERELDKRLAPLSQRERQIWLLDYNINTLGVRVNIPAARKAVAIVELEEERLDEEMRRVTQQQVATCRAHVQLKTWINDHGYQTPGVAKDDIALLLTDPNLPDSVRAALLIRQEAAKTSTAKLAAMLDRACSDDRIRGIHQYHGANTGRWAGRGVQTQNFPRPTLPPAAIDTAFQLLDEYDAAKAVEWIEVWLGRPLAVISDALRGFLVPSTGSDFIAVDYSAIEARKTAWLAGEEWVLNVFRTHGKIYEDQAAKTYRCPIELITKDDPRRQVGKAQTLGFGFGGGVAAIQKICKSVGIKMEPAFDDLWRLADHDTRDRAIARYKAEVTKARKRAEREGEKLVDGFETGISQKEWLASELSKVAWRQANTHIVRYWSLIELAAIRAVQHPGKEFVVHPDAARPVVTFKMRGSFLQCTLPSGRRLTYPYPRVSEEETPWGAPKHTLTYMTEDSETRKWMRCKTYGGSLTENVVQASARDLLAEAMLRLDEKGYPIVMHVHDEVVVEASPWDGRGIDFGRHTIEAIVKRVPAWASGLPIAAEGWRGKRYRK